MNNNVRFLFQMLEEVWASFLEFLQFVLIVLQTFPRDLRGLIKLIRHNIIFKYNALRKRDFIGIFRQNVQRDPSKTCFILDDKTLSFQEVCWEKNPIAKKIHIFPIILGGKFNQSISEFLLCRRLYTW